ncbi:MAG: GNAT family N-acetyltransferase [Nostoc sp.]|uniref:GNAT family N-acetyltransferase n=1 Tax=Nostoc sp. TaxID=1180 RepID=UPI002FFC42F9
MNDVEFSPFLLSLAVQFHVTLKHLVLITRMAELKITVDDNPDPESIRLLISNLVEYNNDRQLEKDEYQPLAILLRDPNNTIVAGLVGKTQWGWLFISHLWVTQVLRGQGYGRQLVLKAEEVAKQRGCSHVYLDTFSFQSLGFYERLGYEVFGVLKDFPPGHKRYFLQFLNIERRINQPSG